MVPQSEISMETRHGYGLVLALVGLVLAGVQTLHGLQQSRRPIVLAFEALPFVLVALVLVYAGVWLAHAEAFEPDLSRIFAWGVGTTLLFASVSALMLFGQRVSTGTLDRSAFVAIDLVTLGAVVGILIGLYDARGRRRRRELQHQRDRIEEFGHKAADVNNYGRTLYQSDSVHEISALCIEAMQALLGLSEVAVLVVGEDDTDPIDNTVINTEAADFASLVEDAGTGDRATVVTHEDLPDALADRGETALSILLTDRGDRAVVAVAVVPAGTDFDHEDVQLVELLASHVGTALDGTREFAEVAGSTPGGAE